LGHQVRAPPGGFPVEEFPGAFIKLDIGNSRIPG
ncbi:unnamed protein product, partial [marine sediment metagenome]